MPATGKKFLLMVPSLTGGGGQKVAATLCEGLGREEDLQIVLVVFDPASTGDLGPSVKVRHIEVRETGGAIYTVGKFFKVVIELAGIIRREQPLAILSFMDYCNTVTLLAWRLAASRGRVVISVHTLFSAFMRGKGANARGRLLKLLATRLYRRANAIIAVSRGAALDLAETFGLPAAKIRVIGNPFDLAKISRLARTPVDEPIFKEESPILLSVGRLAPEKGGENLLRAFALLRRKTEARLVFLGEGPEKDTLARLCRKLGIERHVFFLGYRANPFRYMARSTVFVLSSLYEGFGNVLIEAMACGLPVVATRCYHGIEEIVEDGVTGLLVETGDEKAMAEALLGVLDQASLRRDLVMAAREKVKLFDKDRIVASYRTVLEGD